MSGLLKPLYETPEFKEIEKSLRQNMKRQMIFGVTSSYRDYIMAGLAHGSDGMVLIVTPGEKEAAEITGNLGTFLDMPVYHFPSLELIPFQILAQDRKTLARRLEVLEALCNSQEKKVVVASVEAVMRRLCPCDVFSRSRVRLTVGERQEPGVLLKTLVKLGYERVDLVESTGQVSLRGGILDIYPTSLHQPVRLEFFDDEVDSIRIFDALTQRSYEKLKEITIGPALELVVHEEAWERARETVLNQYQLQYRKLSRYGSPEVIREFEDNLQDVLEYLNNDVFFPGIEQFLPYFYSREVNLIDYLPAGSLILMDEPQRCKDITESIQKERLETYSQLMAKGKALPSQYEGYVDWRYIALSLEKHNTAYFCFLPRQPKFIQPQAVVNFTAKAMHNFLGKVTMLAEEILHWRRTGYAVVLTVSNEERGRLFLSELRENKIDAFYTAYPGEQVKPGNVIITPGHLSGGFELVNARLVIIAEKDIYGRQKKTRRRSKSQDKQEATQRLEPFVDLKVGDYVVHANHGIGKYMGIVPLDIAGIRKEYLLIKYSGEDKLYVPNDQVGLLQKYLGAEADSPKLSRLGGSEWSKAKGRVKQAVREMADDLLKLYAAREADRGYAFNQDSAWQQEFEGNFPYEETPDQIKAIEAVKRDMERSRPMDRLLCGDVGYGKTEVALRAAFKAIMDGKQVAVLVPTTILAQQHFNTFRERFSGYPIRVEMLSRFRTAKEQGKVIEGLASGMVDIVIGTHRLVQNDVKFSDLGLLVVDEEQRFGVAHKEKLKQIKVNVDVLTLTATPIPRTLHMSLVGVRDTSILETPPENRFPVQTYVLEEDPVMIREAIRREIGRGGQVYFVHNRVMDLHAMASWLQELVPEARLAAAHGQMKEDELEQVMLEFLDGAYDVLVCTTIIESGLDISNVNTLIVKEASNFGLAQLYQLRGRVGRSTRMAYAYLTFRKDKVLNELAEKRLGAIREFTEFGSGYKIAMRDLEIRGAGNILGAEQHGHIAAVGFEMYCRLLEEAVREARGEKIDSPVETTVELPVEAYIPDHYIPDTNQKVEIYRRIAKNAGEDRLLEIEDELVDRFGDLPDPVQNLVGIARVKNLAGRLKIKSISKQQEFYKMQFSQEHNLDGEKLVKVSDRYAGKIKFNNTEDEFEIRWRLRDAGMKPLQLLDRLEEFLHNLA
ncbi:MAG: transcription-repair coupling factor [Firmicutes bacterium]|nr:transcription-repair coupling factor [Bacillota bacterium]